MMQNNNYAIIKVCGDDCDGSVDNEVKSYIFMLDFAQDISILKMTPTFLEVDEDVALGPHNRGHQLIGPSCDLVVYLGVGHRLSNIARIAI